MRNGRQLKLLRNLRGSVKTIPIDVGSSIDLQKILRKYLVIRHIKRLQNRAENDKMIKIVRVI